MDLSSMTRTVSGSPSLSRSEPEVESGKDQTFLKEKNQNFDPSSTEELPSDEGQVLGRISNNEEFRGFGL